MKKKLFVNSTFHDGEVSTSKIQRKIQMHLLLQKKLEGEYRTICD